MSKMTVLELIQCLFWGLFALFPLFFAVMAVKLEESRRDNKETTGFYMFVLAIIFQAAAMICAYKAGGK